MNLEKATSPNVAIIYHADIVIMAWKNQPLPILFFKDEKIFPPISPVWEIIHEREESAHIRCFGYERQLRTHLLRYPQKGDAIYYRVIKRSHPKLTYALCSEIDATAWHRMDITDHNIIIPLGHNRDRNVDIAIETVEVFIERLIKTDS